MLLAMQIDTVNSEDILDQAWSIVSKKINAIGNINFSNYPYSDEDPDPFNENLTTDEDDDEEGRFIVVESGTQKKKRALIHTNGYKFARKSYDGRDYVSNNA